MISEFDRAHVGQIIAGDGDWFSAHLLWREVRDMIGATCA
jgi:hypothetical protein